VRGGARRPGGRGRLTPAVRRSFAALAACLASAGALAGAACEDTPAAVAEMPRAQIEIDASSRAPLRFEVRVADTPVARAAGFQDVCPAGFADRAILFVYDADRYGAFHMRNVHAALDIAFAASDGAILEVQRMLPGAADPRAAAVLYWPARPFRFALEVPAGWFEAHGVPPAGARLAWSGLPRGPVAAR